MQSKAETPGGLQTGILAKQGFSQVYERGKVFPQARRLTLLVCRLHIEFPGDLVHSLPQMRMPVPAYCRRRSRSLRFASAKVLKGCFCTMLSSRLSVWPSGCTWSEQKYSEHAGHGLSLGALFSSSHLSANSPKHLLQYLALMV